MGSRLTIRKLRPPTSEAHCVESVRSLNDGASCRSIIIMMEEQRLGWLEDIGNPFSFLPARAEPQGGRRDHGDRRSLCAVCRLVEKMRCLCARFRGTDAVDQ